MGNANAWQARHGMTSAQYQSEFNNLTSEGYCLVYISGYSVNNQARYAAIWEKKSGPAWVAKHGMTSSQYQSEFNKYTNKGYLLVLVNGYTVNNLDRYVAIWEKKSGPAWVARHGMTSSQYQSEFDKYGNEGYRLSHISGYSVNNQARYAAIWEEKSGPAWVARHGMTSSEYQGEFNNYFYQGYRLKLISGYSVNNQARYAAIWESHGMSSSDINFIDSKIKEYMKTHNIPGISIAITNEERLVFAKGYGYADQGKKEKVNPAHLFRIASISKPITAITIMKLIEDGKLQSLDQNQKVFGSGGILGTQYGTMPYSNWVEDITVQQLLEHTSGWTNNPNDPMFVNLNFNHSQLITDVLDNRPVQNEPETTHVYLNFGYCLLGRIIEEVTGQSYESYVKNNILSTCGITNMQIAGDTKSERKPNEVIYYGNAYGMKVARMDAHGGWIASPIDLLRIMVRTDGSSTKPDILKLSTIINMFTECSVYSKYGKGWMIDNNEGYKGHNGSLPGTFGFVVIRDDGFCFAVLVNTRPAPNIKKVLDDIVDGVSNWPTYDLF